MIKARKVGIFVPSPVKNGGSASVHNAGIGRIPQTTHDRLWKMLNTLTDHGKIEIYKDLNFRESIVVNNRVFCKDFCINDLDSYFWYGEIDRKIGSYDFSVLKALSLTTKVVRDPYLYERALDKHTAYLTLRNSGVRVPESLLFNHRNISQIEERVRSWGKCILKPRRGGFGKGVTLITDFAILRDVVGYIESTYGGTLDGAYLLEKYYENDVSRWASATIVEGKIVYGYRKKRTKFFEMGEGKFKVYDENEIGGEVELCQLTEDQQALALAAYKALGVEIVGFDMIWANGTPIIVDVNTFPGYYEDLFKETSQDSALVFFDLIKNSLNL